MTSQLFSPLSLRGLTLDNRVIVSPMCQYSANDGTPGDWHLMHLGQFAKSGAALVIAEAAAVEPRGRISPGCLGIYSDENEEVLAYVVAFCRSAGNAKLGIQLAHAGRKASTHRPWEGRNPLAAAEGAWETLSSATNPHDDGWHRPTEMTEADMDSLEAAFVESVHRADRIGFDMIELHSAHGYLLHQFLSPIANTRSDAYGGNLENRMRFPLKVFEAMRAAWPEEKCLGVRISSTDWVDGSWDTDQAVVYAGALRERGCDYICTSSGGVSEEQKIILGEGYQVAFAERIRHEAEIPTMAVGMIFDPLHAESLVAEEKADMVALARGLLFDPHWPVHAAAALGVEATSPPQYARAYNFDFLRDMEAARHMPERNDKQAAK